MTKQQEMQLKKGAEVFVKGFFNCRGNDGDAYVNYAFTNSRGERVSSLLAVTSDSVFLRSDLQQPAEKSKYDPCRPFKKGDIVTPIERDGREVPDGAPVGEKCTVVESEKNGIVCIRYEAGSEHYIHEIPYFHLELVTPVEELEQRFFLDADDKMFFLILYGKPTLYDFVARLDKKYYSKAMAEDECARLNAVHRKEEK